MNTIVLRRKAPESRVFIVVTALVISTDMITKGYMRFHSVGFCNDGVIAGISSNFASMLNWVFFFVVVGATILIMRSRKLFSFVLLLGTYLLTAGGLSNQISRVIEGCVYDWLQVGFYGITVNFADLSISAGAILCILGVFYELSAAKNKKG